MCAVVDVFERGTMCDPALLHRRRGSGVGLRPFRSRPCLQPPEVSKSVYIAFIVSDVDVQPWLHICWVQEVF